MNSNLIIFTTGLFVMGGLWVCFAWIDKVRQARAKAYREPPFPPTEASIGEAQGRWVQNARRGSRQETEQEYPRGFSLALAYDTSHVPQPEARRWDLRSGTKRPVPPSWLRTFNEGEPIASFLPIHFSNGASVDELTYTCAECKEQVPYDAFRGHEMQAPNGEALFKCVAYCESCKTSSSAQMRLFPTYENGGGYGIDVLFDKIESHDVLRDRARMIDWNE